MNNLWKNRELYGNGSESENFHLFLLSQLAMSKMWLPHLQLGVHVCMLEYVFALVCACLGIFGFVQTKMCNII